MQVGPENAYSRPFWRFSGVQLGVNGNFLQFYAYMNAIAWDWRLMNQTA